MTVNQTDAGLVPLRFRVLKTVSSEAATTLKVMYEAGEQQPAPTRPEMTVQT